jgi:hypothetical protein
MLTPHISAGDDGDVDIDTIIAQGEQKTAQLNSKYEGLNFDDLSNFKSEAVAQTWEGEDFQSKVMYRYEFSRLKF